MCLAALWRHGMEWDRTALVGELLSIAKEFVQEVLAEDDNALSRRGNQLMINRTT